MLRPFAILLLVLPPVVVAGCPVYGTTCLEEGDGGDCAPGYACKNDVCVRKRERVPAHCHESDDCPLGMTCNRSGRCETDPAGTAGEGGVPGAAGVGGQT